MVILNDISPKNDGGVLKEVIQEGIGDELPFSGCKISVHYTGTLLDGTKFDSSRDRNQPFSFDLGKGKSVSLTDKLIPSLPFIFLQSDKCTWLP